MFWFYRKKRDEVMDQLAYLCVLILSQDETIKKMEGKIMATLDEVLAAVQSQETMIDGISTLIAGLKQQLADALAGSGALTPEVQAKIDQIFAEAEENRVKLADALAAGVPA